jgi:purine nucleosidase
VPVFADVDTGVDDAMALVYLLASRDTGLSGIACTGGNVGVDQVCANNLGLLDLCRASLVPVSKGSEPLSRRTHTAENIHGATGLGYAQLPVGSRRPTDYDAATAWIRAAHAHPGQLVGVVTGPLTNLALALHTEPELPRLVRRLVIMGGAFGYRGNVSPVTEFNIGADPEAAAEVFATWKTPETQHLPVVCGLELTENVAMTPAILAAVTARAPMDASDERGTRSTASNPLIRVLEDAMRFYFEAHYDRGRGYLAYLHDPLAAAVALDPGLVTTRPVTVDVELAGTARGMTVTAPPQAGTTPNVRVGVDVDPAVFFDRFIERVGALALHLSRRV